MKKKITFIVTLLIGLTMICFETIGQNLPEYVKPSNDGSRADLWITALQKDFGKSENTLELSLLTFLTYTDTKAYCNDDAVKSMVTTFSVDQAAAVPALVTVLKVNDGYQFIITSKMADPYKNRMQCFYIPAKELDLKKIPKGGYLTAFMNNDFEWEPGYFVRDDPKDPFLGGTFKSLYPGSNNTLVLRAQDGEFLKKMKFSINVFL